MTLTWLPANIPVEVYTPLSTGRWLLIFVGIPVLFIALVYVLVSAPSWTRAGRHRPGHGWDSDPVLIASSAGSAAEHHTRTAPSSSEQPDSDETGGSSARW